MRRYYDNKIGRWELSTMDKDPLIAAEKFLTMLEEHYEKYDL